jgi:hypothetical protein
LDRVIKIENEKVKEQSAQLREKYGGLKKKYKALKWDGDKWYDQNLNTIQKKKRLFDNLKKDKTKDKGHFTVIVLEPEDN